MLGLANPEACATWVADKLVVPSDWAGGDQLNVRWDSDYGFAVFDDATLLAGASACYLVAEAAGTR